MKNVFLIVCLVATTLFWANAQEQIGTINLTEGNISEARAFSSNDTIMLSFKENGIKQSLFRILPDSSIQSVHTGAALEPMFVGYEVNGGNEYSYFLNKKGKSISALHINLKQQKKELLKDLIMIEDPVIDVIGSNGITIVTVKRNAIEIIEVSNCQIAKRETVAWAELAGKTPKDFSVIQTGITNRFYEADHPIQIYVNKDFIKICVDVIKEESSDTRVLVYNRKNKTIKSITVLARPEMSLKSSVVDSLLFRLEISNQKLVVSVFNVLSGVAITEKTIFKTKAADERKIYFYNRGEEHKSKNVTLENLFKTSLSTQTEIIAWKTTPEKYSFVWGTFYDQDRGLKVVGSGNPLTMLVGTAARSAVELSKPKPVVSRYSFGSYEDGKIDIEKEEEVIFKQIDDYEINNEGKGERYCGYWVRNPKIAYSFVEELAAKTLKILRFGDPLQ